MRDIFSDLYHRRAWGDGESVSGPGSSVARTSVFRNKIAALLEDIEARSVLDAGCGDFNWMKEVRLDLDRYVGVDVVPQLIDKAQREYGNGIRTFICLDITNDTLPQVDVILCRDCLVHYSIRDIGAAVQSFKASGSTYLLTTTFTRLTENADIQTGEWRPINLQLPPFNFPEPLKLIDEKCTESGGTYADKRLGLWALEDIPFVDK